MMRREVSGVGSLGGGRGSLYTSATAAAVGRGVRWMVKSESWGADGGESCRSLG